VARGTQHRKRRPHQNAQSAAVAATASERQRHKQKTPQWQEELFFSRLRNHAKWVFVFLAVVFAVSFVFFGVGSGSTGITDALQNAFHFGGGGTSVSKLQSKADKNPTNALAWRNLATALEQKQRTQEAVNALERYTALKPKDGGALAELASQYGTLAQGYSNDYTAAQNQALASSTPASAFAPASTTALGKAFQDPNALKDPISAAVESLVSTKQSTAYSNYQTAQQNAEKTYQKIVALNPNDATTQIQLGQAAQAAQDPATAVAAYTKFLKLAPTDPLAAQVKAALKALKAQVSTSSSASG
jgi:tetratricopeptide (TPR) repeat protein